MIFFLITEYNYFLSFLDISINVRNEDTVLLQQKSLGLLLMLFFLTVFYDLIYIKGCGPVLNICSDPGFKILTYPDLICT